MDDTVLHLMLYAVGYLLGMTVPYHRADWHALPTRLMRTGD